MNNGDYHLLKAMFESFGKDLLTEFKVQYKQGKIDLDTDTKHEVNTIIKAAVKCFVMYTKAKG
jgi:hypothetical protein